jgi:hypothetical protein
LCEDAYFAGNFDEQNANALSMKMQTQNMPNAMAPTAYSMSTIICVTEYEVLVGF